jgi:hypothetical protein
MGAFAGPDIVENSLVLALDAADFNSFKGSAATNLLYSITNTYGTVNNTYFKTSYGDVVEYIPELGYKTVRYCNIWNDYNAGSGECCPSPLRYGGSVIGQNITVSPSTTYTYQIIYKVKSGYTHPNFMYRYEYGESGYLTEGGVHSESNRTSLGNDWWFAWGQFTTQSTTTYLWLTGMWYYQYNVYDTIYVAGVSLHQGTNIIPAKFMLTPQENRGTTVATGGGWADLIGNGNHGELVNGVRESSDNGGNLVFDGADDRVISNFSISGSSMTISLWTKPDSTTQTTTLLSKWGRSTLGNFSWLLFLNWFAQGNLYFLVGNSSGNSYTAHSIAHNLSVNVWTHFAVTYSSGSIAIYRNGQQITTSSSANTTLKSVSTPLGIGHDYDTGTGDNPYRHYDGSIAQVSIYNRALTASEISQNFNMLRGRFGI